MDWIRRSTRLAIYLRDSNECIHCGNGQGLTLHHVKGDAGGNGPDNLVTLCQACNQAEEKTPCGPCPRCVVAMVSPLDRKEGLRLAKARWPERYQKEQARRTRGAS